MWGKSKKYFISGFNKAISPPEKGGNKKNYYYSFCEWMFCEVITLFDWYYYYCKSFSNQHRLPPPTNTVFIPQNHFNFDFLPDAPARKWSWLQQTCPHATLGVLLLKNAVHSCLRIVAFGHKKSFPVPSPQPFLSAPLYLFDSVQL